MLLQLQRYHLKVVYKPGKELLISDTLSRAYLLNEPTPEKNNCDVFAVRQEEYLIKCMEEIDMVEVLPITAERLADLLEKTEQDESLQKLKHVIKVGWPDKKEDVPAEIRNYFYFKEELTIQDGILFKGNRVIAPVALRPLMVKKVHSSHIGIEGCLRKARDVLFWPGMSAEIKDSIGKCDTCNNYQKNQQKNQQKEPLIPHDPPKRPWSHVAADLFTFNNKEWLIIVDYWPDYLERNPLPATNASTVITSLKGQFARHGIPDTLYSDNGPQFSSREFQEFASDWQFDHQTSSPHYPQSNVKVENAVKSAKKLLTKAKASGQDPYLTIRDWRNTPSASIGAFGDEQRRYYRRLENCSNSKSWKVLRRS